MRPQNSPQRGFTLIEVLVAMAIMATLALMSWQGVDGIMRARAVSQGKLESLLRINTVLAQWEQDLYAVQDTGSTVPAMRFDGATLTMTRRTPGGLQIVVWSLKNGAWYRWAGPAVTTVGALQDSWVSTRQFIGNEPGQLRALGGVSQWQLYYFRDNTWSNAQSSAGTSSDTAKPGEQPTVEPPPQGVRLLLTFEGSEGLAGSVTRDIALGPQQ